MLDIAGGVVIGGFTVGMFYFGFRIVENTDQAGSADARFGGWLILISVIFSAWLLFWHTGLIPGWLDAL